MRDRHGNFEVVVPEGAGLVHYWLDNSVIGQGSWSAPIVAIPGATGPGAILGGRGSDDLEAVGLVGSRGLLQAGAVGNIDLDPDVLRGDQPPASGGMRPRRVVQPA